MGGAGSRALLKIPKIPNLLPRGDDFPPPDWVHPRPSQPGEDSGAASHSESAAARQTGVLCGFRTARFSTVLYWLPRRTGLSTRCRFSILSPKILLLENRRQTPRLRPSNRRY